MNRFDTRNIKNKAIKYLLVLLIIFSYYFILKKTNFLEIIKEEIKHKYNNSEINIEKIKTEIVYKSLNKIVDLTDINISKSISLNNNNLVYIYNTHDTEKYTLPFTSDYSIIPDVTLVSKMLKEYLKSYNIDSYIESSKIKDYLKKNKLKYSDSYEASRYYLKKNLNNNYELILDIHRDSLRRKYTLYEKDNKKYARILFIIGASNKNYKKNKEIAENLNSRLNNKYKGMSRGVTIREDATYNQDLNSKIILVKIGGIDNTLEELNNTIEVFSKVISDYIKEI
ncbi:MAG: stage II sporulation protein P [Mollicutes bacterium]|nr:stage II sporulation protein P [Mollicutes bacterium]